MSQIVESLDRLQKERRFQSQPPAEENAAKDSLFSKFGILLWLGASISATIFSYHLGVKQGMQAAKTESPKEWLKYFSDFSPASGTNRTQPIPTLKVQPAAPAVKEIAPPVPVPEKKIKVEPLEAKKQGFTIQVITYMSERLAKEEVDRLSKKGHKAFVVPSGKYFQVCMDLFDEKKLAVKKLTQLRTQGTYKTNYPGAYIKFLKQ